MIFRKYSLIISSLAIMFFSLSISTAIAQTSDNTTMFVAKENFKIAQDEKADNWPGRSSNWGLNSTAVKSNLTSGEEPQPFARMIGRVISPIMGITGSIFVVLIVYAGVTWMTAGGNEERITKAKKVITAAAIGLLVVVFAYAIARFVTENLLNAQQAKLPQQSQDN